MSPTPSNLPESPAAKSRAKLPNGIERILSVEIPITIRLGATEMCLQDVLRLEPGTIVELDTALNSSVELFTGGCHLAKAELVAVGNHYGVRITEVESADQRIKALKSNKR